MRVTDQIGRDHDLASAFSPLRHFYYHNTYLYPVQRNRMILSISLLATYLIVVMHSGVAHCHALPHEGTTHQDAHDHIGTHSHSDHGTHDHGGLFHFLEHLLEGISHMHAQADNPVVAAQKSIAHKTLQAKKSMTPSTLVPYDGVTMKVTREHSMIQPNPKLVPGTHSPIPYQLRGPPKAV